MFKPGSIEKVKDSLNIVDVVSRYIDLKRAGTNHVGLCPFHQERTPSFSVSDSKQTFNCYGCGAQGDAIDFVQKFEELEFLEALRKCADFAGVILEDGSTGPSVKPFSAPTTSSSRTWSPSEASTVSDLWREKAGKFVAWCHEQLIENQQQLDYLAERGIPREAVAFFGLGWNPGENGRDAMFRDRKAWGLEPKIVDGKNKKLWLPRGIVIPYLRDGELLSVWIRRPKEDRTRISIPYLPIDGSSNDNAIYSPGERAFVVVESRLCAMATAWASRGLAGALSLDSASVKPKTHAAQVLGSALCILVATDFEMQEKDGIVKSAGGTAAAWWSKNYRRAERWPVPVGKDPGDYVKDHGGDLRAWVSAGLKRFCPAFTVADVESIRHVERRQDPAPTTASGRELFRRAISQTGRAYCMVRTYEGARAAMAAHPGEPVFYPSEIAHLKGAPREVVELIFNIKEFFKGGRVIA